MQVGERERKEIIERVEKEMLDIVSGRLVDPTTKRVYTPGMISKALDQLSSASGQQQQQQQNAEAEAANAEEKPQQRKPLWRGVEPNKSAKSQALEAMKALIAWQPIPVMRARMRLRITCPVNLLKQAIKAGPAGANNNGANKEKESSSGGGGGGSSKPKNKKGGGKGKKSRKGDSDDELDAPTPTPAPKSAKESKDSDTEAAATKTPGTVKDKILSYIESIETQEVVGGDEWEVVGFADPGAYKGLNEFVGNETRGRGRVEVLDMTVTHEE